MDPHKVPPYNAPRDYSLSFSPFSSTFRLLDPTSPQSTLLLISSNPGLWLTIRLHLRAPRVGIFSSLPFFSVLNSRNVLHQLFSFSCLFAFFLWSRTSIDDPSSSTCSMSKHLLFSFERLDWLLPFYDLCLFLVHFCLCFLLFQMSLYVLGCFTCLANMLVYKKKHLCIEIRTCTNEHLWAHIKIFICLEK